MEDRPVHGRAVPEPGVTEMGLQFICLIIGRVYLDKSLMVDLVSYRC